MTKELEALEDLVSSEGWLAYRKLVEVFYNTERLKGSLLALQQEVQDPVRLGQATGSLLAAHQAVDFLIELPYNQIEELKKVEEEEKHEADRQSRLGAATHRKR